jgi:hypothetical protein
LRFHYLINARSLQAALDIQSLNFIHANPDELMDVYIINYSPQGQPIAGSVYVNKGR